MEQPDQHRLRRLPKVDEVLRGEAAGRLLGELPRWAVVAAARAEIDRLRQELLAGRLPEGADRLPVDPERLAAGARRLCQPVLRRVINATGVVLHTNLGRAPLPPLALSRIREVAGGYCNLEYRLEEGERGSRHEHTAELLAGLTGAEAHLVVNNNAAAVLLALSALCAGREVVVSRGELVEIGGSFRVPDVMRASGARLREVGTTNRTHRADYEAAIGPESAALLKVHRSNFAVLGFVAEVGLAELAALARERGLLSLCDLGSGALVRLDGPGGEPTVRQVVGAGIDLCTFSGDKLLGGPQAGIVCGRRALIERLRRHPLQRALRPDKLTLIALAATLELYRDAGPDGPDLPALRMLRAPAAAIRARAERLLEEARARALPAGVVLEVVPVQSAAGGGSLPLYEPPSFALSVSGGAGGGLSEEGLHRALRRGEPPVVARSLGGRLVIDLRTVQDAEVPELAGALHRAIHLALALEGTA